MKINSGFITNSSSASRTELYIKNYFLASILKKYKAENSTLFYEELSLYGNGEISLIRGAQDSYDPGSPDRSSILDLMIGFVDEDENKSLITELESNSEKIISNMLEIKLKWQDHSWDREEQDRSEVTYNYRKDRTESISVDFRSGTDELLFPEDDEYFEETGGIYDPNFAAKDNWV